jgi:hypothetical protein
MTTTGTSAASTVPLNVLAVRRSSWLVPLLPRPVGLIPLVRRRVRDPLVWFLLGTTLAGLGATLAFRQPGSSEILFLSAVYPVGLVGSAWGLVLVPATRARRIASGVGVAIGIVVPLAIAAFFGANARITGWIAVHGHAPSAAEVSDVGQILWWAAPLALLVVALAVLAGLAWIVVRRNTTRVLAVGIVSAVLGTGLLGTVLYLTAAGTTIPQVEQRAQGSHACSRSSGPQHAATGRPSVTPLRDTATKGVSILVPGTANMSRTCAP